MDRPILIFLGPPGSGKGTQAAGASAALGIPAISTGELLRQECQSGSRLGHRVQRVLATGRLVGDDLMNQVVASRLKRPDCGAGCILDGYPRTLGQAKFLDGLLEDFGWGEPTVCDFDISGEQVVARLGRRRQCPSCSRIFSLDEHSGRVKLICDRDGALLIRREDDNPKVIRERMRLYAENANEIVPYYARRQYYRISAARPASDILQDVLDIVRCGSLQRVNGNQTRAASQTIAAF